jgi:hypothetical protein
MGIFRWFTITSTQSSENAKALRAPAAGGSDETQEEEIESLFLFIMPLPFNRPFPSWVEFLDSHAAVTRGA